MGDGVVNVTDIQLEKLFADPTKVIELHNLIYKETEKILDLIAEWNNQISLGASGTEFAREILAKSEKAVVLMQKIYAYGGYFGTQAQRMLWKKFLSNIANLPLGNGNTFLLELRAYPALLVMYAGTIGAIAANNYLNLKAVMDSSVTTNGGQTMLVAAVNNSLLSVSADQILGSNTRYQLSNHLAENLKKSLPKMLVFDKEFDGIFDRAEAFIAIIISDFNVRNNENGWAPLGRFAGMYRGNKSQTALIKEEIETAGEEWPPLKANLFGGKKERALAAIQNVETMSRRF